MWQECWLRIAQVASGRPGIERRYTQPAAKCGRNLEVRQLQPSLGQRSRGHGPSAACCFAELQALQVQDLHASYVDVCWC